MTCPPTTLWALSNCTWKNFPKREELLFRTVLAFPKASSTGLLSRICCWILPAPPPCDRCIRYCRTILVASVFPAPDSPLIRTLWFVRLSHIAAKVWSATA